MVDHHTYYHQRLPLEALAIDDQMTAGSVKSLSLVVKPHLIV